MANIPVFLLPGGRGICEEEEDIRQAYLKRLIQPSHRRCLLPTSIHSRPPSGHRSIAAHPPPPLPVPAQPPPPLISLSGFYLSALFIPLSSPFSACRGYSQPINSIPPLLSPLYKISPPSSTSITTCLRQRCGGIYLVDHRQLTANHILGCTNKIISKPDQTGANGSCIQTASAASASDNGILGGDGKLLSRRSSGDAMYLDQTSVTNRVIFGSPDNDPLYLSAEQQNSYQSVILKDLCRSYCHAHYSRSFHVFDEDLPRKLFVKGSARLSSDVILATSTSPLPTISRIRWYLHSMFLLALWARGSFEFATAPLLSQYTVIPRGKLGITFKSTKKFLSQTAYFAASEAAMYSASMVDSATHFCLALLHEMAQLLKTNVPFPDYFDI
ncbi:cholesterol 7-alpha-monooxygenase [Striga asiatica]|uniref:Cholesterol 7-alpha-monooxygenase n=1 Tax=Striga asiatica TaxID=4170 RepID=A0A5A7Q6G4_STRAF|nr:cholesterol 7-alpha-monooxygenase [Striga asiatica]